MEKIALFISALYEILLVLMTSALLSTNLLCSEEKNMFGHNISEDLILVPGVGISVDVDRHVLGIETDLI